MARDLCYLDVQFAYGIVLSTFFLRFERWWAWIAFNTWIFPGTCCCQTNDDQKSECTESELEAIWSTSSERYITVVMLPEQTDTSSVCLCVNHPLPLSCIRINERDQCLLDLVGTKENKQAMCFSDCSVIFRYFLDTLDVHQSIIEKHNCQWNLHLRKREDLDGHTNGKKLKILQQGHVIVRP